MEGKIISSTWKWVLRSKFALSHFIFLKLGLTQLSRRTPLPNGHDLQESLKSHSSMNTSAHHSNHDIEAHDFAPKTNGVAHSPDQDQDLDDTQTSLEPSSSLTNSGETGESIFSSSQSVPDDVNKATVKLDEASLNLAPTVIEQPTSDLREKPQPTNPEQTTETEVQDQQKDKEITLDSHKELSSASHATTSPANPQPETTLPSPPREAQADPTEQVQIAIADTTVSSELPSIPAAEVPNHPPVPIVDGAAIEAPLDPAPSPSVPATTSTITNQLESAQDQTMHEAPSLLSKVAREREDDDLEDGPATKRPKTDNDPSPEFKAPERPAINTQVNGEQKEEATKEASTITTPQFRALIKIMNNIRRLKDATAFRLPVNPVELKIPTYYNYVTKPMDLKTLEDNLKAGKYPNVDAFRSDFDQIVENSRIFNGPEHVITKAAYSMQNSLVQQWSKVPGPDVQEPSPAEKKKKAILPPPAKASAPRRESRSSLPGPARSPVSTASTPTFALGPQGVPLIRRDSTLGDGRPKREIHPPASKDLLYQKPKKKKYQNELKFCDKVLSELGKPRYTAIAWPFMVPVDPVALNIPTYHSIVKKPMDFGTMRAKLDHGEYENAKEFELDAKQVFQNCYKFNREGDQIYRSGQELEKIFDDEWAGKRKWIEHNTPASGAQSPGSSEAEDSDEEEEEEEEEDEEADQLSKLQQQIAQMSRQVEMITQKKKSPPASGKKGSKNAKAPRKDSKKSAAPAKVEKKAPSKPAKRTPYITYEQKQDISVRINSLNEKKMSTALEIIRSNMPSLKVS